MVLKCESKRIENYKKKYHFLSFTLKKLRISIFMVPNDVDKGFFSPSPPAEFLAGPMYEDDFLLSSRRAITGARIKKSIDCNKSFDFVVYRGQSITLNRSCD